MYDLTNGPILEHDPHKMKEFVNISGPHTAQFIQKIVLFLLLVQLCFLYNKSWITENTLLSEGQN